MYVYIDLAVAPGPAELRDPDSFTEFKILIEGADDAADAVGAAAARLGRVAGPDHVFVEVELLERLAGERAEDEEWSAQLEAMIEYAKSKGWTDEAGAVRAHVERAGAADGG